MRTLLKLAIAIGSSFVILALLLKLFSSELGPRHRPSIIAALLKTDMGYVAAYAMIFVALWFIRSLRYRTLIQISGEKNVPTLWQMSIVTGIRNMTVDLLPGRLGELSYVGLLNKGYGVKLENCATSLALSIAFDIVALVFIAVFIVLSQVVTGEIEGWAVSALLSAILFAAIAFVSLFIVIPFVNHKFKQGWLLFLTSKKWFNPISELLDRSSQSLLLARKSGKTGKILSLSIVIRVLKYFGLYLLFMAIAKPSFESIVSLSPEKIIGALIGGEVGASLPIPAFMSFGPYEAGSVLIFHLLGVADKAGAFISILGQHIISQVFDYTLGGTLLFLFIMINKTRKKNVSKKPSLALWITTLLVCIAGSGLLAFEYRVSKKMGTPFAPTSPGESKLNESIEWVQQTQSDIAKLKGFAVWSSNRNGNHDILKMTLPDMVISRLTTHSYTEYYPRVSPDGTKILFSRSHEAYVSQRNVVAWDLYLLDLDSNIEKLISEFSTNGSWLNNNEITFLKNGNSVIRYNIDSINSETLYQSGLNNSMPGGALIATPSFNPFTQQLVFTGLQSDIGSNTGYWGTALYREDQNILPIYNGCQIFWSSQGDLLYQVIGSSKGGNQFATINLETLQPSPWLDLDGEFSHEYFPKTSNTDTHLIFSASRGGRKEHEHDLADYEIFIWEIGSNPNKATRLTFHSGNDNWPDVYLE